MPGRNHRDYDPVTLAHKVETEIFRPAGAPKGSVDVNVNHGVVELRGVVATRDKLVELGDSAAHVQGVKSVHNLLHTPGEPPGHSPPSDPAALRERLERSRAQSSG